MANNYVDIPVNTPTNLPGLTSASALSTIGTITTGVWNGAATSSQSFITSGTTYMTPAGVTTNTVFKFTLVGGGGGGSGFSATGSSAAGGGGGGAGIVWLTGLTPSTTYSITIGAGGVGGSGAGGAGGSGGNTTLVVGATTYTAAGGAGVTVTGSTNAVGGAGGACTNTTIKITGQSGMGADNNSPSCAGTGGCSGMGFGLGGAGQGASTNGLPGTGYGGGGGGSHGPGGPIGGAGTAGCILVEWKN